MRGEDNYKLKELLRVSDYLVQDIVNNESNSSNVSDVKFRRVIRRDSSRWTHAFLLVHVQKINCYTLYCRTLDEKKKWMEALTETYESATLSDHLDSGHCLEMTTFDRPTSCEVCFKLLKGLFFQGYKCSKCSRSVHRQCAAQLPFCGQLSQPPSIPPRPIAMQQLPMVVPNGDSLDESRDSADELEVRTSSYPLPRQGSDGSTGSLVLAPPDSLPTASITSNNYPR